MDSIHVSEQVKEKLRVRHQVAMREVYQCFENRHGKLLTDQRELTRTDPPTLWFIARTNQNRLLKIVYIQKDSRVILKTAFSPNATELELYERFGAHS
jgi:hypothetical protein